MASSVSLSARFGSTPPQLKRAEWKRLGAFVALGAAIFLVAMVGAAFVPFSWPDAIRRSAHPTIFVPLATILTVRFLRKDAIDAEPGSLFNASPVNQGSSTWLLLGGLLAGIVVLAFVLLFGLRWNSNPHWSVGNTALMMWAIVLTAAAEEIAFRGYALWRLIRLIGFWPAQIIVGILFMFSHLTLGGYSILPAVIGTITGSILYGVAFARTGGIAAPIALHTGWNIVQHLLLSPLDQSATPVMPAYPHPASGREYAVMVAIVGIVMIGTTVAICRKRPA